MFCSNCGTQITDRALFCNGCGSAVQAPPAQSSGFYTPNRAGFSTRIQDPAFAKYIKNTNRVAGIFASIIAIVAIVGFYIAGETSTEMDNPQSLYIGFGIGGMFLLIALFQILGKKRSKTWNGTVVDKKVKKKRRKESSNNQDWYWVDYIEYTVFIRSDDGKTHQIRTENSDLIYNYYQIGDRVRHHAGLKTYEKYDKSRDSIIFCNACSSLNKIEDDVCFRCKCPLLK